MPIHARPRNTVYIPPLEDGGPELYTLLGTCITFKSLFSGHVDTTIDDWNAAGPNEELEPWTGATTCLTVDRTAEPEAGGQPEALPEKVRTQIADMASSRPWAGDEPPMSIYVDLALFVRCADGIWRMKATVGCLYPVNGNGERYAKPKSPSEVSPHAWWNVLTNAERLLIIPKGCQRSDRHTTSSADRLEYHHWWRMLPRLCFKCGRDTCSWRTHQQKRVDLTTVTKIHYHYWQ